VALVVFDGTAVTGPGGMWGPAVSQAAKERLATATSVTIRRGILMSVLSTVIGRV
jgi:hypothetical protein